jgi:hypothetical protein
VKTTLVRVADAQGAFAKVLAMYNTIKLRQEGHLAAGGDRARGHLRRQLLHRALAFIGRTRSWATT